MDHTASSVGVKGRAVLAIVKIAAARVAKGQSEHKSCSTLSKVLILHLYEGVANEDRQDPRIPRIRRIYISLVTPPRLLLKALSRISTKSES